MRQTHQAPKNTTEKRVILLFCLVQTFLTAASLFLTLWLLPLGGCFALVVPAWMAFLVGQRTHSLRKGFSAGFILGIWGTGAVFAVMIIWLFTWFLRTVGATYGSSNPISDAIGRFAISIAAMISISYIAGSFLLGGLGGLLGAALGHMRAKEKVD